MQSMGERDVMKNEQYMADAASSVLSNFLNAVKRKNSHVWSLDPSYSFYDNVTLSGNANSEHVTDDFQNSRNPSISEYKMNSEMQMNDYHETWRSPNQRIQEELDSGESENEDESTQNLMRIRRGRKNYYSPEVLSTIGLKLLPCGIPKKSVPRKTKKKLSKEISSDKISDERGFAGNSEIHQTHTKDVAEFEDVKPTHDISKPYDIRETELYVEKSKEHAYNFGDCDNFEDWCRRRNADFLNSSEVTHDVKFETQNKNKINASDKPIGTTECVKRRIRPDSTTGNVELKKKVPYVKRVSSRTIEDSADTMLSITVKGEKSYEIMAELHDFHRLRRTFPKFSDIIPNIDSKEQKFNYSADAVKTVLGFLFSPSYNFNAIQNEVTAVEILAIVQSWDIVKFQSAFQHHFLQNILKESNASKIYTLSEHFNLREIKEACSKFPKDLLNLKKFKEKTCSVEVSTYMDPLEYCIPLQPTREELAGSFDRNILNELVFESVSGSYTITGFQIQLNVDDSVKNDKPTKIEILYSVESMTEELSIPQKSIFKSLGSTIIIYFKNKLVVQPRQKIKISIETVTKPCLCYTFSEEMIRENSEKGEFNLTLSGNRFPHKLDRKVFFLIGKLFYHLKKCSA